MKITAEEARLAGEMARKFAWTDSELALVIAVTELSVAFLEGRGEGWSLALIPLRQELRQLEGFAESRKQHR